MFTPIPGVRVIGVGHKARQGKDTFARILAGVIGRGADRYAFADAIKSVARAAHGMTTKDPVLLQLLGTEVYRDGRAVVHDGRLHTSPSATADPEVWLRTLYYRLDEERPEVAILTDVRFPNEFALVKAMGGTTVRVQRVDAAGRRYIDPHRDPQHASEIALDAAPWDYTLDNPENRPRDYADRIRSWWARYLITEEQRLGGRAV